MFHNLKNSDEYLLIEELGKFDIKANFISNVLQKHMNVILNNRSVVIDSFQFSSSSLDSLVKNLGEN